MPVVLHINGRNSAGALAVVDRTAAHVALSYAGTTPVADTTNPKFGGASVRLNNGPIYVSDASVLIGQTEDFTIQGWFEWESVSQVYPVLFGQRAATGYSPVSVWLIPGSGVIELYAASASLTVFRSTYAFTPTLGAWYHVAVTRNGGTMTLWLNGNPVVVLSIGAGTALFATTPFCIGGTNDNDYRLSFDGRFDDFQVVRGQALYTAAFTPPSELAAPNDVDGPWYHPASLPAALRLAGPTPVFPLQLKSGARPVKLFDRSYGGRGLVTNTVKVKGTPNAPAHRKVWLMRERDGVVIRETWSDPVTGVYAFPWVDERERYTVIGFDYEHNFRAVIADNLTPELMP